MTELALLTGAWRLAEARSLAVNGDELAAPYGPEPMGQLVLTTSGRMMAVLCDGRNIIPEGEKRAYASYCGNYEIVGDVLITTVDAALISERIGGQQRRRFELDDRALTLYPPRRADGSQRVLRWERQSDA